MLHLNRPIWSIALQGGITITKRFRNLEAHKQKRIINAALKEFTEKGYEQASTNQIVKDAGIGKGMLFYYFNSKRGLYNYLINYCIEMTESQFLNLLDTSERDFFKRLKKMSMIKLAFLKKHPDAMNFLGTILINHAEHLTEALTSRIEALQKAGYAKMYDNLDYSLFREDVDVKKAFDLIRWSFDGYEQELKYRLRDQPLRSNDLEPYFDEFFDYLDIMRRCFYKTEGEGKT